MENILRLINLQPEVKPLCFFDIETTGVDPNKDRIVSISVVKIMPDGSKVDRHRLVNPTIPISEEATEVNGITNEMVKDAPTFAEIASSFKEFISGCNFAGYNSNYFDKPMLIREFEIAKIDWQPIFKYSKFIDVFNIFRHHHGRKLSDAYRLYVGGEIDQAHTSSGDTNATIEVFDSMLTKHDMPTSISDVAMIGIEKKPIDVLGKIYEGKNGLPKFSFGKYKDVDVLDVVGKNGCDKKYFDWMKSNNFSKDTIETISIIINDELE